MCASGLDGAYRAVSVAATCVLTLTSGVAYSGSLVRDTFAPAWSKVAEPRVPTGRRESPPSALLTSTIEQELRTTCAYLHPEGR